MLHEELYSAIKELPSIDIHSHMKPGAFAAKDITDVIFYHMLQYPFRSSGVEESKLWLDNANSFHGEGRPVEELDSRWPVITNTGFAWVLRLILKELYGYEGELSAQDVKKIRKIHKAKSADPHWAEEVLRLANVKRIYSSSDPSDAKQPGSSDPEMQFTLERSPEFGIYEFFSWQSRFKRIEQYTGNLISSMHDMRKVNRKQYERFDWNDKKAVVWWVSSCADFTPVDNSAIDAIIKRCNDGERLTLQEEGILEAAYIRSVCAAVHEKTRVFQLVYGTQFITPGAHPVQRAVPQFTGTLRVPLQRFPETSFQSPQRFRDR